MSRDQIFTPDIIIFMLDYDGCTADLITGMSCTGHIMAAMIKILTEYSRAKIILKVGSYRQSIALNYGNWEYNDNGCCFSALENLLKIFCEKNSSFSDRVEIDPFILEDISHKKWDGTYKAHGAHFKEGCRLKTLADTKTFLSRSGNMHHIAWHDETKIAELYAHMQQSAIKDRNKKILLHYYDDRDDIHAALGMAFTKYRPKWVPRDLVMRRIKCVDGMIVRDYPDIVGEGCIDENYPDTATFVHDLFQLHKMSDKTALEASLKKLLFVYKLFDIIKFVAEINDVARQALLFSKLIVIAEEQKNRGALEELNQYIHDSHFINLLFCLANENQLSVAKKMIDERPELMACDKAKEVILILLEKYNDLKDKDITKKMIGDLLEITRQYYGTLSKKYRELHRFYLQIMALEGEKLDDHSIRTLKIIVMPSTTSKKNSFLSLSTMLDEMMMALLNSTKTLCKDYQENGINFSNCIEGYRHYRSYRKIMFGIIQEEQTTSTHVYQFLAEHFGYDLTDLAQNLPIRQHPDEKIPLKTILSAIDKQASQSFYAKNETCPAAYYALRLIVANTEINDISTLMRAIGIWKNAPSLTSGKTNYEALEEAERKIARKRFILFTPITIGVFLQKLPTLIERAQQIENRNRKAHNHHNTSLCAIQ